MNRLAPFLLPVLGGAVLLATVAHTQPCATTTRADATVLLPAAVTAALPGPGTLLALSGPEGPPPLCVGERAVVPGEGAALPVWMTDEFTPAYDGGPVRLAFVTGGDTLAVRYQLASILPVIRRDRLFEPHAILLVSRLDVEAPVPVVRASGGEPSAAAPLRLWPNPDPVHVSAEASIYDVLGRLLAVARDGRVPRLPPGVYVAVRAASPKAPAGAVPFTVTR